MLCIIFEIERFYLIYWPEELCVSMHSSEEVLGTEGRVGDDVPVLYNKETLKGQIAGVGKYFRRIDRQLICKQLIFLRKQSRNGSVGKGFH